MTEVKFFSYRLKGEPATLLAKEVKILKNNMKRIYSSYHILKDFKTVLAKYEIISGDITHIPQFISEVILEDDTELQKSVKRILEKLKEIGESSDRERLINGELSHHNILKSGLSTE
ncbi:13676_t:CDS:2 [Ambispora leptoticha]|uniref:13676_t:CDS:1 n=1 Tax=Ambispora leptoticha TaxID=144679 RepID=A0A9N9B7T4_9GLOM|nr:13676_t:CDS:2 [Ambispora leptoticha]